MNYETDVATSIASSIKRAYGFRGAFSELVEPVAHTVTAFTAGGVEKILALDDLVDVMCERSGRARLADIDTVTKTVLSLFEALPERGVEAI